MSLVLMRRAGLQMSRHRLLGANGDGGVVAEAGEPVHERLLAKPGKLALGVAARGLRNCFCGGSERDGAFQVRSQLAIPDEVQWFRVMWNAAADEVGNFFKPAAIEHRVDAPLDVTVQRIAVISTHTYASSHAGSHCGRHGTNAHHPHSILVRSRTMRFLLSLRH